MEKQNIITSIKEFKKYLKSQKVNENLDLEDLDEWDVVSDWGSDRLSPKYNVSYNILINDINDFLAYYNSDLQDESDYINIWKERYNLNEVNKSVIRKLEDEIWSHLVSQAKAENAFQEYADEENKRIEKQMLDIPENYIHLGTEDNAPFKKYKFYHKGKKEYIYLDDYEIGPITNKIIKISPDNALSKYLKSKNNK